MSDDQIRPSTTKASLKDLKETFDFFDSDDSQTITLQELEYVVLLMGGRYYLASREQYLWSRLINHLN